MIKHVHIQNYRSIEDLRISPTALCALVGENNAGKSNILRALKTALTKDWLSVRDFSNDDFMDRNPDLDIMIKIEFDPPPVYHGFKNEDPKPVPFFEFLLTRYKRQSGDARAGDLRLQTQCLDHNGRPIQVLAKAPKKGQTHQFKPLTNLPVGVKSQVPLIYVGPDRRLAEQLPHTKYSLLRRMLEDVAEAMTARTIAEGGEERPLLEVFGARLESALDTLRIDEFIELESTLRIHALENLGFDPSKDAGRFGLHFGLFDAMDFLKSIKLRVDEGRGRVFEAVDLGDGAQNAILVAIFQAYESMKKRGAVFLIEEPEMYLHPHRARYFYETLRRVSKYNQVIYTTHSPQFVSIPEYNEVQIVYRDSNERTDVRTSDLSRTAERDEKFRKELDATRNELFFAKTVVLVEGDTERLALPEFALKLSVDLDRLGCSVIEASGKRSLYSLAELIMSFQIPLTIVYDRDSSDFSKDKEEAEEAYNASLNALSNERTKVICLDPNYENELRGAIGEHLYQDLCQRYPGHSKVVRGRLIAADQDCPVPEFIREILQQSSEPPKES